MIKLQVLLESYIFLLIGKYSVLGNFSIKTLFQTLWPLLYKRAEFDLRLQNCLSNLKIYFVILIRRNK